MSRWMRYCGAFVLAAGCGALVCSGVVQAQAPDPMFGMWKLDVAKSKFSPGPAPKGATVIIEKAGAGRKVRVEAVAGDGTPLKWGYTSDFDGKDVAITGTNPDADTVSLKRLTSRSTQTTYKKNGKPTIVNSLSVSGDGKTLTVSAVGTNAQGQKVENTQVYQKEPSGT